MAKLALPGATGDAIMKNDWAWIILVAFTVSVALQLWLEHAHKVDSLGLWYTALSAGLYTIPAAIVLKLIVILVRK